MTSRVSQDARRVLAPPDDSSMVGTIIDTWNVGTTWNSVAVEPHENSRVNRPEEFTISRAGDSESWRHSTWSFWRAKEAWDVSLERLF